MRKLFFLLFAVILLHAQEFDRNIMIEVFTNSHCPLCPSAHSTIDSYLANGEYGDRVRYIYYHMSFPYSDDQLHQANPQDASGRNQYYGPYSSTPRAFFDGQIQSNNYNQWSNNIDTRVEMKTPVKISLSGGKENNNVEINADVEMSSSFSASDLVIHFIVVEDVEYNGRNGINNHKNVMRDMITDTQGESISISSQQTFSKSFSLNTNWRFENLTFVVFVQNSASMEIYQSEWIDYSALGTTSVNNDNDQLSYTLHQNYPNPFNPTTTIKFTIPANTSPLTKGGTQGGLTKLIVYNLLGQHIKFLINKNLPPGSYLVEFDGSGLPSGLYFYKLETGNFTSVKKMMLVK